MKNVFFSFLLLYSLHSYAQINNSSAKTRLDEIITDPYFQSSLIAVDIYDLTTENEIYKKNEKYLLHPASNMKILTTAAALNFLGPEYKFETSVYFNGTIRDSTLFGDIFITGGGDPDFTSDDLDSLVRNIKNTGIKNIKGNLYGDVSMMDSLYWGEGWMWDDDPYSDFPYLTPLTINDECITFFYVPGEIGSPVSIESKPASAFYTFKNYSVTTDEDTSNFEITRDWMNHRNNFFAKGDLSFLKSKDTVQVNVANSSFYFLTLAQESLKKNGIKFNGLVDTLTTPPGSILISKLQRSFASVLNNLNKESDNLSAEMTLRALALAYGEKPATAENGIKLIDSLITIVGFDPGDYRIVDGSGVSHYNLVTAELINGVFEYFYVHKPYLFDVLYDSFSIAGIDGTLEKRMTNGSAYNNVHAKTGTLSGVSVLSGFLTSVNGHTISFSIFIQNFVGKPKKAQYFQDKICQLLCSMN